MVLHPTKNLDHYPIYKSDFENIIKNNPDFAEMAQIETPEGFESMMKKELLFDIFIQNEWAGYIGVEPASESFLNGYEVYEEFLISKFRGQHFAPAAQRHLIEKLPDSNNAMLYGTIHYNNVPSIKTALKVGRKKIGQYIFVNI